MKKGVNNKAIIVLLIVAVLFSVMSIVISIWALNVEVPFNNSEKISSENAGGGRISFFVEENNKLGEESK